MYDYRQFYINGQWVTPTDRRTLAVINPANEAEIGCISMGNEADVETAVQAARGAFDSFSRTSRDDRVAILERLIEVYKQHYDEMAAHISDEMGAPITLAKQAQAGSGLGHLYATLKALKNFEFESDIGSSRVLKEPVGVCAMITPWNWPINQIACKVAPAIAAGCTMVLKPSEIAPLSGYLFSRIVDEAGVPAGVYNMVNGDGPDVGAPLSAHPEVDMVSFTGSTRAGSLIAKAAADTVKRVSQELGGKSANIILEDADFAGAVSQGVDACMNNTGQSCNAPTRMLVPRSRHDEAVEIAVNTAKAIELGDTKSESTTIGPLASDIQYGKVVDLVQRAVAEGSQLACGGAERPEGLDQGYYVKPTIFANVTNDMLIAREEVFGPVLAIIPYDDEEDAVRIANDTPYGLSGYVSSGDIEHARSVAARLRTGMVHLNGAQTDIAAPFGGYKQSGNGREWGEYGLEEFLEVKAVMGYYS